MKDLFPGHYKPSEKEFKQIWDECTFVFDTNILLNVYRYSEKTRDRLFEILSKLQDRIWIPYQVAYEYQEERLNVISNQLKPYQDIQNVLDESIDKLTKTIEPYRSRHSFTSLVDSDDIIKTIERANKRIIKKLEKTKNEYPNLIENDIFRDKISDLFLNKISLKPEEEESKKILTQAKTRLDHKIPPGYKDKDKSENHEKYGDVILWLQLLKYAEKKKNSIVFVTDDNKEDWWKVHKGKTISPRPELIQEMKVKANVDFWMYTGDRFLEYAENYLKLQEQPDVVKEATVIRYKLSTEASKLAELLTNTILASNQGLQPYLKTFAEEIEQSDKSEALEQNYNLMRERRRRRRKKKFSELFLDNNDEINMRKYFSNEIDPNFLETDQFIDED